MHQIWLIWVFTVTIVFDSVPVERSDFYVLFTRIRTHSVLFYISEFVKSDSFDLARHLAIVFALLQNASFASVEFSDFFL